jgi:hypothetical protein
MRGRTRGDWARRRRFEIAHTPLVTNTRHSTAPIVYQKNVQGLHELERGRVLAPNNLQYRFTRLRWGRAVPLCGANRRPLIQHQAR